MRLESSHAHLTALAAAMQGMEAIVSFMDAACNSGAEQSRAEQSSESDLPYLSH